MLDADVAIQRYFLRQVLDIVLTAVFDTIACLMELFTDLHPFKSQSKDGKCYRYEQMRVTIKVCQGILF